MRESEARKLKSKWEELVRDLDLKDSFIIDFLFKKEVLTPENKETIKVVKESHEKNRCFLDILLQKDDDAYRLFYEALKENNESLWAIMDPPGAPRRSVRKTPGAGPKKGFEDLTPMELKEWLHPRLEREEIPDSILETLIKEEINGKVFMHMTNDEFKEVFPGLNFGTRKKLEIIKDKIAEDLQHEDNPRPTDLIPSCQRMEHPRPFGHSPEACEKYRQNKILNVRDGRTRSSLLHPLRQFYPCADDNDREQLLDFIAEKVVVFAAACMNDRQNGTVYFGVGNATCQQYSYGQILGLPLIMEECRKTITDLFKRKFKDDDSEIAIKCIRTIAFVELILDHEEEDACCVCEVDIEPKTEIVGTHIFFVNLKGDQEFYRLNHDGAPEKQDIDAIMRFQNEIEDLKQRRHEGEKLIFASPSQDLPKLLNDFMCGGGNKFDGSFYPLLATSALGLDSEDPKFEESFKFLWHIDFRCVFDFDAKSDHNGFYHYMENKEEVLFKLKTFQDFSPQPFSDKSCTASKSSLEEVCNDISESELKTWIFCNGYEAAEEKKLAVSQWKRERSAGFKEAVRYFRTNIPDHRAVIVILVTSNDDVFIEASEELLLRFQEQWIMISESKQLAEAWIDGLQKRNIDVDLNRCVWNFSFVEISKAILQLSGVETIASNVCVLKSSTGIEEKLPKKKVQELCDLELVSTNECNSATDYINIEQTDKEKEEDFYKGNRATWWNFYCPGHVCPRDRLEELKTLTRRLLDGNISESERVGHVVLYHQPGAGGTTLAMNVVWDLHKDYKCCILKRITDFTAGQIISLQEFGEENPDKSKPVLALIDNEEENIDDLINNIEKECHNKGIERLVCVLLVCFRTMAVPQVHKIKNIFLQQKLSEREKQFFVMKYEELKRKGRKNLDNLLGLNIMKENFNEDYIKRVVSNFVDGFRGKNRTVLKYVAVLNCYDLRFRPIPVSCFDLLFLQTHGTFYRQWGINVFSQSPWENNLSPEPLMLETRNFKLSGRNKCLRISNKLLCNYVLDDLCMKENMSSHFDLMDQFLFSPIFNGIFQDIGFKELVTIVKEIMKKRGLDAAGKKPSKFSPFIQMLYDNSEVEKAVKCIETVFEKTGDAYLAQQIARIHICDKNWDAAEIWAKTATDIFKRNSFIWDTLGQVYKCRLEEIRSDCEESNQSLSLETAKKAVKFAKSGWEIFQMVDELSKTENTNPPNTSGLFSQMETIILLTSILQQWRSLSSDGELQKVLSGVKKLPADLQVPGLREHAQWLATLQDESFKCLAAVQNTRMMYVDDSRFTFAHTRAKYFLSESNIRHFENKLNRIFGEASEGSDPEKVSFDGRRRMMRTLGGNNLYSVMNRCGRGDDGKQAASEIFQLAVQNLTQDRPPRDLTFDLTMALASALTLISCHDDFSQSVTFCNLLQWSSLLCKIPAIQKPDWDKYINLDPYILFLVFHWPTESRNLLEGQSDVSQLNRIIALLKEANEKLQARSNQSSNPRNNNPIFFITNKPQAQSFISRDRLKAICGKKKEKKISSLLRSPLAVKLIERFSGLLQKGGREVKITGKIGQFLFRGDFVIPLFVKESRQILWNKRVYFALGIGLGGPIACDVDIELPKSTQMEYGSEYSRHTRRLTDRDPRDDVNEKIEDVRKKLNCIQDAKMKPNKSPEEIKIIDEELQLKEMLSQLKEKRRQLYLEMI